MSFYIKFYESSVWWRHNNRFFILYYFCFCWHVGFSVNLNRYSKEIRYAPVSHHHMNHSYVFSYKFNFINRIFAMCKHIKICIFKSNTRSYHINAMCLSLHYIELCTCFVLLLFFIFNNKIIFLYLFLFFINIIIFLFYTHTHGTFKYTFG